MRKTNEKKSTENMICVNLCVYMYENICKTYALCSVYMLLLQLMVEMTYIL